MDKDNKRLKLFMTQESDDGEVDKEISGLIQCSICHGTMDNPKALPCLHSFCLACLKLVAENGSHPRRQIECPMCKKTFNIPPAGLEGLVVANFYVTSLKDRRSRQEKLIPCTSCEDSAVVAVARCLECKDFLCEKCFDAHKTVRLLKSHRVCTLKELKSGSVDFSSKPREQFCELHKGEKLYMFCTTCSVPVCQICSKETHPSETHSYADLSSSTSEQQAKIQKLAERCQKMSEEVGSTVEQIKEARKVFKEAVDKAYGDVDHSSAIARAELLKQLDQRKQNVVTSLWKYESDQNKVMEDQLQGLLVHQARLQNALGMVSQVTKSSSQYAIAELYATLTETLQELGDLKPQAVQNNPTPVKFTPYSLSSSSTIVPRLGYLSPRNAAEELDTWVLQKHIALSGQLNQARGVVVHPNGDIAVADIGRSQVLVYDKSGEYKFAMGSMRSEAHGIAVSSDGRYFVTGLRQFVDVYNSEGAFQYKFAAMSPSNTPSDEEDTRLIGVTVDQSTQELLVGDTRTKYISKHNLNGTHISSMQVELEPWYIVVTSQSTIIASSYEEHAVHMLSQDGEILHTCSIPTGLSMAEWSPTGICLSQDTMFVNNFSSNKFGVYAFCSSTGTYMGCATNKVSWPTGITAMADGGPKLLVCQGLWLGQETGIKVFGLE